MVVSGGVNYTRVGAVAIVTDSGQTLATYGGNTAMGVGVKVGFTFYLNLNEGGVNLRSRHFCVFDKGVFT